MLTSIVAGMPRFSRLGLKLSAILAVFIGLAVADYLIFNRLTSELANSASAINTAGRQRFLSQKIAYLAYMVGAGHRDDVAAGKKAVAEFEAALEFLEKQGAVGGARISVTAARVRPLLEQEKTSWHSFEVAARWIFDNPDARGTREFYANLARVDEHSSGLVEHAEAVTVEYQRYALELTDNVQLWLMVVVIASLGLSVAGLLLMLYYVSVPVNRLAAAAESLASGGAAPAPAGVMAKDEVGVLQRAFYKMSSVIRRDRDMKEALRALLDLSLQPLSLELFLERALNYILSVPWLSVEPKGALFLADKVNGALVMQAHRGLSGTVLAKCARLKYGQCLCGKAAQAGETLFSADVDAQHENTCEGIQPHGHYCVPIKSHDGLLGVFTLYLRPGHAKDADEVFFLENVAGLVAGIIQKKLVEEEQRKLAEVLRQTSEAVFITETDGRIIYVNKAFERMTGFTAREAEGKTPNLLKSGAHDERYYQEMWTAMEKGVPWEGRIINRRKDGTPVEVQANIFPVKDMFGRSSNYVAILEDLSGRLALEEQLRQSQKMEAVGRLAGGIAHDFNNILMAIGGYAQLMGRSLPPSSPAAEDLCEIGKAVAKASALTKQLLAFSRKQRTLLQAVDIGEILLESRKMYARLLGERISLEVAVQPGLKPVRGDRGQIDQVIINLLVNGADAMPEGGKIYLSTAPAQVTESIKTLTGNVLPGEYSVLSVRDSGAGIKAVDLPKIFEPFFTTKPKGKGTGLGLSIVHGIALAHNARVSVESAPGAGAEFRLYFPVSAAALKPAPAAEKDAATLPGIPILLVDDDRSVLDTLARSLRALGAEVAAFERTEDALAFLSAGGQAGLIVTDVVMPGISGFEFIELARKISPGIKAVYMSGYTDPDIFGDRFSEPGIVLLHKPFQVQDLAAAIADMR